MGNLAIRVEGLGKQYRLGHERRANDLLVEALSAAISRPLKRLLGRAPPAAPDRTIWALKDVTFDVAQGEVVGIIGANGAGKSTLLKILSRITPPTEGGAEIFGRLSSLLEIGTGFHPELTGRENVYLNGAILGLSRAEINARFEQIVEFAGINAFLDTPVKRYSSGMYVRLAFAVAAHLEPDIMVVDEVLAVGDHAFQKKCLGRMSAVASEGRTVLFVSHNMGAVRNLCRQVLWIDNGRPRQLGPAGQVIGDYLAEALPGGEGSWRLDGAERTGIYGRSLRLLGFELNGGEALRYGEPWRATFHFRSTEPVTHLAVALGFCLPDGTRIATLDSAATLSMTEVLPPHTNTSIDAYVPRMDLQPGAYLLDLGIRGGAAQRTLDYLPGYVRVQVLATDATPGSFLRGGSGGVRMRGEWSTLRAADELPSPSAGPQGAEP